MDDISEAIDFPAVDPIGTSAAIVWYLLVAIALWRVFSKAGYAGVLSLVPVVNLLVLAKIAGYSLWAGLLLLLPIIGFIFGLFVALRMGQRFGKGNLFSVFLLWLLNPIGYFLLGFGSAQYDPGKSR